MATRKIGTNIGTVTIGGATLAADCFNCRIEMEVKTAEGKAVIDTDDYPVPVGRRLTMSGEFAVSGTTIPLAGTVNSSTPVVTFTANTGAGVYSGTAVITQLNHKGEREALQTFDLTLVSQGAFGLA